MLPCLPFTFIDGATIPLSTVALFFTPFKPRLLLLSLIVIVHERFDMFNKRGRISGDVAYASWTASSQTSATRLTSAASAGIVRAVRIGAVLTCS